MSEEVKPFFDDTDKTPFEIQSISLKRLREENEKQKAEIAKLKYAVASLERQCADQMSGCCDCSMFKAQTKRIAELEKALGHTWPDSEAYRIVNEFNRQALYRMD